MKNFLLFFILILFFSMSFNYAQTSKDEKLEEVRINLIKSGEKINKLEDKVKELEGWIGKTKKEIDELTNRAILVISIEQKVSGVNVKVNGGKLDKEKVCQTDKAGLCFITVPGLSQQGMGYNVFLERKNYKPESMTNIFVGPGDIVVRSFYMEISI